MKTNKRFPALAVLMVLCACGSGTLFASGRHELVTLGSELFTVTICPVTLETKITDRSFPEKPVTLSRRVFRKPLCVIDREKQTVFYPSEGLTMRYGIKGDMLFLSFSSIKPCTLMWPSVRMEKRATALIWPHFEGHYIPLDDGIWTDYLLNRDWDTTADLYMPFWGIEKERATVSCILENPFHNSIRFSDRGRFLDMECSHEFPGNSDLHMAAVYRFTLDRDVSPVTPALHFRKYLEDRGEIVTLEEKMKTAPPLARMIGAPHAYLWGGDVITAADILTDAWLPLAREIVLTAMTEPDSTGAALERVLADDFDVFRKMDRQKDPDNRYLRNGMVQALSCALESDELCRGSSIQLKNLQDVHRQTVIKLCEGVALSRQELVRLNSHVLYASFPEYLHEPASWGDGISTRMIDALKAAGLSRFRLTVDDIEGIDMRPHIARYAAENGYIMGTYDAYDTVHDPDNPEWTSALFDRRLYETGAVHDVSGNPVKGFNGVGFSMSPVEVKPYFDRRIASNFRKVPFSSYFIDGDAFGHFLEDYTPGRWMSASENARAKSDRICAVYEKYGVPVGSEGGSYLFAGCLAVAEGVFFPVLGKRGDPDMELNEMSRYYLGRYFPSGEPECFFMEADIKKKYVHLCADPRYRLPLYEAVLHDSVVTTAHWASPTLKFRTVSGTVALTGILYQSAPMYHLTLEQLAKMKELIKHHADVFQTTHSYSYKYHLEEFEWLTADRLVQRTRFGDLVLTSNFRNTACMFDGIEIPGKSIHIMFTETGESFVYTPMVSDTREKEQSVLSELICQLSHREWAERFEAARAIANAGVDITDAVPALMAALDDPELQVRRAAVYALAYAGINARKAVPALTGMLADSEWMLRKAAAVSLGYIGDRRALPELAARETDPEIQVRMAAEWADRQIRGQ